MGTATLRETVDASLHEIVNIKRRLELVELFAEHDRFDWVAADEAWGGDS